MARVQGDSTGIQNRDDAREEAAGFNEIRTSENEDQVEKAMAPPDNGESGTW